MSWLEETGYRHEKPTSGAILACRCLGSGVVLARLKSGQGTEYAFRCVCLRGKNDRRNFPSWADVDRSQFEER